MTRSYLFLLLLLCPMLMATSCVTEPEHSDTPAGNFSALWDILDQHYCFFAEKAQESGLDWDEVRQRYSLSLTPTMNDQQLFEVCATMLRELQDGHVNLASSFDVARYWDWYERYPLNFSDSLHRRYLGTDYKISSGIKYKVLDDNIGYVYCGSFQNGIGSGNLNAIFSELALCRGIIIDVRNNEGGLISSAQALAESFTNEKITGGYICHKTGPGHDAFSSPEALTLTPSKGIRWQKKAVVITNRRCFSAANTFVMFMKACPNVTVVGARTGGGGGMPFQSELPNGWTVRFSACPMFDKDMVSVESGIDPDIAVNLAYTDRLQNLDSMIETARRLLKEGQ